MSEISSGLVAVAWNGGDMGDCLTLEQQHGDDSQLVRLSDAEAIIAQKDAEIIEQCRINGMGAECEAALLGKVAQQSAALKLAREALEYYDSLSSSLNFNFDKGAEALAAIDEVIGE